MEVAGKRTSNTLGTGLGLGILGTKRKSGEMMDFGGPGGAAAGPSKGVEDEERIAKVVKLTEDSDSARKGKVKLMSVEEPPSLSPRPSVEMKIRAATVPPEDFTAQIQVVDQDEPLLDTFKKRLEGFGARHGKSMGKSLGGTAAQRSQKLALLQKRGWQRETSWSGDRMSVSLPREVWPRTAAMLWKWCLRLLRVCGSSGLTQETELVGFDGSF
ncbi:uncharacterized protein B0H18DRAFT_674318 [Fomitopsis serialis]|uniref:uncharacterized protein n=1 Tax=Fomitopsis serialis TaxID=139415 RepID=UPI002008ACE4|nr:uncharacterized protein B0H18DRAFT_674318 [Neoantrodia serialis]KAH9933008.1 hypothetical protein B0H18DRAFT_674318 [Neoantrodia serialis]